MFGLFLAMFPIGAIFGLYLIFVHQAIHLLGFISTEITQEQAKGIVLLSGCTFPVLFLIIIVISGIVEDRKMRK